MKTECVGRLQVELNGGLPEFGAPAFRWWRTMLEQADNYRLIGKARTWRRVLITRSHTAQRFRISQPRLEEILAPLVGALEQLGLARGEGWRHVVYQQVPGDYDFVEVALYESCESHRASAAVRYRRARG